MDERLKIFGEAQLRLAQVIQKRKRSQVQIWQLGKISDESGLTEYLHHLVGEAEMRETYAEWIAKLWGGKPGVGMVNANLENRCKAVLAAIAFQRPIKHVIFLGAGASYSAGYPIGERLAGLMKDPASLRNEIIEAVKSPGMSPDSASQLYDQVVAPFVQRIAEPLRLFKGSGYSTIDHFSKEARNGKYANAVKELKKLIRLILSVPANRTFDQSDYAKFIEKLFDSKVGRLRDDIVILTFNYDVCLQYNLFERVRCRNAIREVYKPGELVIQQAGITSGIGSWPETSWSQKQWMSIIQLHGSILYPSALQQGERMIFGEILPEQVFEGSLTKTFQVLCGSASEEPPLAFPFEIFNEDGRFVDVSEFPLTRATPTAKENLLPMFQHLWDFAHEQVRAAEKISFVGMSLHSFLEPGLKYLFHDKVGPTQIVIANPETKRSPSTDSTNICARTVEFLKSASRGQIECMLSSSDQKYKEPIIASRQGVTAWPSFSEFISHELG